MANVRTLTRSFAGGEITPELLGRMDLVNFQNGLAECENFITLPHGPATNRPGFEFVREVQNSASATRLIPFSYSTTQTMVLEFGAGYIRFHTDGATLLVGAVPAWSAVTAYVGGDLASRLGVTYYCVNAHTNQQPPNLSYWYPLPSTPYEIPTPYAAAHLFDIHYVQSADVLTLVHPSYAPRELRRLSATAWTLTTISFAPTTATPAAPTALDYGPGGGVGIPIFYVTTALSTEGLEESLASPPGSEFWDLTVAGNSVGVTPAAVAGAARYNVYKLSNGLYGYIGQTDGSEFRDTNYTPDMSRTPPEYSNPFAAPNDYPGAVSYFEQRRDFGGTINRPQTLWMTRIGTESNMSSSIPTRDDDAVSFRIAAREANTIRHIVPLSDLILLTSSAEWRVTSVNSDAITPTSISVKPQSYIGANNVQPVVTGSSLLYASARGGRMREMVYTQSASGYGYANTDVSILAPHLFDFKTIVDLAFARAPWPILWAVSSDGRLLGLTYVPEQKVIGWHKHTTGAGGVFESVASVVEGNEDALYAVIRRTIDGATVRYVERMHTRQFETLEDAFFVDCGATYTGIPVTNISGLDWLEGATVAILADGADLPQQVVTGGEINLEEPASKVHIGLPITSTLRTLPMSFEAEAFGQGRVKNVSDVQLRVYRSSGLFVGPDTNNLREYKQRTSEPYGSPPDMIESEEVKVSIDGRWNQSGQVTVRQAAPLPLTVVSMTISAAVGG